MYLKPWTSRFPDFVVAKANLDAWLVLGQGFCLRKCVAISCILAPISPGFIVRFSEKSPLIVISIVLWEVYERNVRLLPGEQVLLQPLPKPNCLISPLAPFSEQL